MWQAADCSPQVGQSLTEADLIGFGVRYIACVEEKRHHEDCKPDRGQRAHHAGVCIGRRVQAKQRRKAQHRASIVACLEQRDHDDQCNDAAYIAKGPARTGQAPALALVSVQFWQIGVGENGGKLHSDQPDAKEKECPEH